MRWCRPDFSFRKILEELFSSAISVIRVPVCVIAISSLLFWARPWTCPISDSHRSAVSDLHVDTGMSGIPRLLVQPCGSWSARLAQSSFGLWLAYAYASVMPVLVLFQSNPFLQSSGAALTLSRLYPIRSEIESGRKNWLPFHGTHPFWGLEQTDIDKFFQLWYHGCSTWRGGTVCWNNFWIVGGMRQATFLSSILNAVPTLFPKWSYGIVPK